MFAISVQRTPKSASNAMIAFVLLSLDASIKRSVVSGVIVWRITSGFGGGGGDGNHRVIETALSRCSFEIGAQRPIETMTTPRLVFIFG